LKLLFVTVGFFPQQTGGAESQARLQSLKLRENGHDVIVVTKSSSWRLHKEYVDGILVIRIPFLKIRFLGTIFHLISLFFTLVILRSKFDVIHVHLANLNADISVCAGKLLKKPVYVKLASGGSSGEIYRFKNLANLTKYFGLRNADRVQAISTEIFEEAKNVGVNRARLVMIANGVKVDKSIDLTDARKQYAISLRRELNLSKEDFIFLYLGRIATYKGIDDLLMAWRDFPFGSNSHLLLVGPVALDKPYEIRQNQSNVRLLGNQVDTLRFILGSNCFILPSHGEGMSNSLLEAMANKLPIIATSVGATSELLNFGNGGLIVPPHSPVQLCKAMMNSFENPQQMEKMAEFSYSQICLKYDIDAVSKQIFAEYLQILK